MHRWKYVIENIAKFSEIFDTKVSPNLRRSDLVLISKNERLSQRVDFAVLFYSKILFSKVILMVTVHNYKSVKKSITSQLF